MAIFLCYSSSVFSHQHSVEYSQKTEFDIVPLSNSISLLIYKGSLTPGGEGWSGNIIVSNGKDGVLMVDTSFPTIKQSIKLEEAIKTITTKPTDFVIDTHYHADHAGGNYYFGRNSIIIAQDNTRKNIAKGITPFPGMKVTIPEVKPGRYSDTLPKITFLKELQLHYNSENIDIQYYPNAHTNSDVIVFFKKANTVGAGDIFVRYGLPCIDIRNGGTVKGLISAVERLLKQIDNKTIIIPGHGEAGNKKDVEKYYALLLKTRERMLQYKKQGKSIVEVLKLMKVPANRLKIAAVTNWYDVVGH